MQYHILRVVCNGCQLEVCLRLLQVIIARPNDQSGIETIRAFRDDVVRWFLITFPLSALATKIMSSDQCNYVQR
jgi:hypothetical protein